MNWSPLKTFARLNLVALFITLLVLPTSACNTPAEAEVLEGILQNVDAVNGEITIVTQDGKTVTLKITTEDVEETGEATLETLVPGTSVEVEVDEDGHVAQRVEAHQTIVEGVIAKIRGNEVTVEYNPSRTLTIHVTYSTLIMLAGNLSVSFTDLEEGTEVTIHFDPVTVLPSLESIEDVFRTLGKWEKAVVLREKGLTWAHIARELGFGPDKMHIRLQDIAEERLKAAIDAGCITSDQAEELFNHFNRLALNWIEEIFADTEEEPCDDVDLATLLPHLESIEDVFRTLSKWEKAVVLREKGLSWTYIARELGFGPDGMHAHLLDIAEESVYAAKHAGCLTLDQAKELLYQFSRLAQDWVEEIFADTEEQPCDDVDPATLLPSLESIEDIFRTLDKWEKAVVLREKGLTWAHVALELDYGADKMHVHLQDIAEERLKMAIDAGCITSAQAEELFNHFNRLALDWIEEIFADTSS